MIKLRAYSSSIQCRQPRRVRQRCLSLFKKEKKKGMKYDLGFESGLVLHLNRRVTHCTGQFHPTITAYTSTYRLVLKRV